MRAMVLIGLKNEALKFLESHDAKCIKSQVVDVFHGNGPTLHEYKLNDGRIIFEAIQCVPWKGGPNVFLCLVDNGIPLFEWSDDEIDKIA